MSENTKSYLRLIDEECDAFEREWKAGKAPQIEARLSTLAAEQNPQLLVKLVKLDLHYRRQFGEQPSRVDYASRFPSQEKALDAVFGSEGDAGNVESSQGANTSTQDFASNMEPALEETRLYENSDSADDGLDISEKLESTAETLPGIPGYEIESVLGKGGMGIVYKGHQIGLNRPVALKMILDKRQADPSVIRRFQTEAEAVAKLDHENIVKIYEIGIAEERPFFSLEFVEGGTLEEERDGMPLEPDRCVNVVLTLARAMHQAHSVGLVHRDLKPGNILVRKDGVLKVTDFGLVKQIEEDSGQTEAGAVMGTPSFMAPEQARGEKDIGPAADVYGLGAIFYCLLTGRPPFQGPNAVETILQVREAEPVPPRQLQPKIPADLETICITALQKDIHRRYASAEELADDLDRYQKGIPIKARPVGRAERTWRWCRRNPIAALAIVLGLCLAIGGPMSAWAIDQQRIKAVAAQELAEANEIAAKDAQGQADENARIAGEERNRADENAKLAGEQRDIAIQALNTIVENVPNALADVPKTKTTVAFKRELMLKAMGGLNAVVDKGDSFDRDFVIASYHSKMGKGLMVIGEAKHAHDQFQRSYKIIKRIAKTDDPATASRGHLLLGRALGYLGLSSHRVFGALEAKEYWLKALEAREAAKTGVNEHKLVRSNIAEALGKLNELSLELGRPQEALEYVRRGVDLRQEELERQPKSGMAVLQYSGAVRGLAQTLQRYGQIKEAIQLFEKAISTLDRFDEENPKARINQEIFRVNLGNIYLFIDDFESARREYQRAIPRLKKFSDESPEDADIKRKLGQAYYSFGVASEEFDAQAARKSFEDCLKIREALAKKDPESEGPKQALMFPLARLALTLKAGTIADQLRRDHPQDAGKQYTVACCYAVCAHAIQTSPAIAESDRWDVSQVGLDRTVRDYENAALQSLCAAIKQGYEDFHMMRIDPDLECLHHLKEFQALLDR